MKRLTIRERLETALLSRGMRPIVVKTSKYKAFEDGPGGKVYFVGKAGALRVSSTPCVTGSYSLDGTAFRRSLLDDVPAQGEPE